MISSGGNLHMKKPSLKHVLTISWILFILGILLILFGYWFRAFWLIIAALFVMLAAIIFLAVFNFLGHAGGASFCPHCGRPLKG